MTTPLRQKIKLKANRLTVAYTGMWVVLSSALVVMLYLTLNCLFGLAVVLGTTAPVERYSWLALIATAILLYLIWLAGLLSAYRLSEAQEIVRHALLSVKEGDLSTRVDLKRLEGYEELEEAFNETMEIIEHRIARAKE